MMKRRLISSCLVIVLLLGLLPSTAFASTNSEVMLFLSYEVDSTQSVTDDDHNFIRVYGETTAYDEFFKDYIDSEYVPEYEGDLPIAVCAPDTEIKIQRPDVIVQKNEQGAVIATWECQNTYSYGDADSNSPSTGTFGDDGIATIKVADVEAFVISFTWKKIEKTAYTITYDLTTNLPQDGDYKVYPAQVIKSAYGISLDAPICYFAGADANRTTMTATAYSDAPFEIGMSQNAPYYYVDFAARSVTGDAESYMELAYWTIGEDSTQYQQGDKYTATENTTFVAHWKAIDNVTPGEAGPKAPLSTPYADTKTDAKIMQSLDGSNWTTENLELRSDGEFYYKAVMQMNPLIASTELLGNRNISDKEFARFKITVNLDSALELAPDSDGNVSVSFVCSFLEPTGKIIAGKKEVTVQSTAKRDSENTLLTVWTITADYDDVAGASTLELPVQWHGGIFAEWMGTDEMSMTAKVRVKSDSTAKTFSTTGEVTGCIDLEKAGQFAHQPVRFILSATKDWSDYYLNLRNATKLDVVDTIRAAAQLDWSLKNLKLTANKVVAVRSDLSYTVRYLDRETNRELADSKVVKNQTFGHSVTETAPTIEGYQVDATTKNITIGTTGNEIIFYYTTITTPEPEPEPETVTVTWMDGYTSAPIHVVTIEEGADYSSQAPAAPTRDGYTFTGWSAPVTDEDGNITITAQWQQNVTPVYPSYPSGGGTTTRPSTTPTTPAPGETITDENPPLASAIGLNKTDHFAYVIGDPEGTVRPMDKITRAEVSTIFFRLMTDEYRAMHWATANSFRDVEAGTWYNNAISTCANAELVTGDPDGSFRPESNITHAEFVTLASRFLNDEVTGATVGDFKDTAGHWAALAIRRAAEAGWITWADDGYFRPDEYITRAEVMSMINRMLDRAPDAEHMLPEMKTWADNPEGTPYYADVQEATNGHAYDRDEMGVTEIWTAIQAVRDWKALETAWAANGGASSAE